MRRPGCEFDCLLLWSIDRLSREGTVETLNHLQRLTGHGVNYRSFAEQYLDSTVAPQRPGWLIPNRLAPFAKIDAKFLAALPNPPVFSFVAAFACLIRSVSTSTFYLEAAPDGCSRFEQTRDEL
jgi:hypothetical protein